MESDMNRNAGICHFVKTAAVLLCCLLLYGTHVHAEDSKPLVIAVAADLHVSDSRKALGIFSPLVPYQ